MYKLALIAALTLVGAGCAVGKPNTKANPIGESQSNVATAKKIYADFSRGDINGVLSAMSDDILWFIPGSRVLPYSGIRHGRSEWTGYVKGLSAVQLTQFEPKLFLSDQDKWLFSKKEQFKVKPTGKFVNNDWAQVPTFKDGKLVEFQSYDDTAAEEAGFR